MYLLTKVVNMVISNSILSNLIFGDKNYCSLCLKTVEIDILLVEDIIVFHNDKTYTVKDILAHLLDPETLDSLSPSNAICETCTNKAIMFYKFVKISGENRRQLTKIVDAVYSSLPVTHQIVSCKSVFVSLNTIDLTSAPYYDSKRTVTTRKTALKRFKNLIKTDHKPFLEDCYNADFTFSSKIISEDEIKVNIYVEPKAKTNEVKTKPNPKLSMPTSDMRVDESHLKCKVCLKTYPSAQQLRQHYIRVHAPKNYNCSKCNRSYSTTSLLKQHEYDSHTPVVCTKCGKTYQNRHSLKMHETGHNTKIMCPHCGRSYKHWKTYKFHISQNNCKRKIRRSNLEATFTCDHCSKKFTNKSTLRVHIQFEHGNGKAHICTWCNKKFHARSRLKAHIVKHTKEKKFCCEVCGGKFVTKESLLYHTRIHTGDKPYQCDLCEDRFVSSSRRTEHFRKHHMAPLFECEFCHRKFKEKACLTRHRNRHLNLKSRLHCSDKVLIKD